MCLCRDQCVKKPKRSHIAYYYATQVFPKARNILDNVAVFSACQPLLYDFFYTHSFFRFLFYRILSPFYFRVFLVSEFLDAKRRAEYRTNSHYYFFCHLTWDENFRIRKHSQSEFWASLMCGLTVCARLTKKLTKITILIWCIRNCILSC